MTDINTIADQYADQYAALKAEADVIAKQLSTLRDLILADGAELYRGSKAWLVVSLVDSTVLDSKLARAFLTPEQIQFASKTTSTTRITIKAPF